MKKSLVLKLVLLAMLSYVAMMPASSEAACDRGECVTFDDGSPGCATYDERGYRTCGMLSIENPPGTWHNFCFITSC